MKFHPETPRSLRKPLASARENPEALLLAAEKLMPALLRTREKWDSIYIDYEKPHLMRIFVQLGDVRLNPHYFLPTKASDIETPANTKGSLYHPHPWFSVMRILEGRYKQWVGVANETLQPKSTIKETARIAPPQTMIFSLGSGDYYSMTNPRAWHQVIPLPNQAVSTLMVTTRHGGWDQPPIPPTKPQRKLTPQELDCMFARFSKFYPSPNG